MITIWAFGTTRGAEVVSFNPNFGKELDGSMIVLPPFCQLDLNQPTLYVFKKQVGTLRLTWIGIYFKAFEVGYKRDGGFVGAGAWINNQTIDAEELLPVLEDVVVRIRDAAMVDGQFRCKLENVLPKITPNPVLVERLVRSLRPIDEDLGISLKTSVIAAFSQNTEITSVLNWSLKDPAAQFFNSATISNVSKSRFTSNVKFFETFSSKDTAAVSAAFEIITALKRKLAETEATLLRTSNTLIDSEKALTEQTRQLNFANLQLQKERENSIQNKSYGTSDEFDSVAGTIARFFIRISFYLSLIFIGGYLSNFNSYDNGYELIIPTSISLAILLSVILFLLFGVNVLYTLFSKNTAERYERELLVLIPLCILSVAFLWLQHFSPPKITNTPVKQKHDIISNPSNSSVDDQQRGREGARP